MILSTHAFFQQAYLVNDLEESILVHDFAEERQRFIDAGFEVACELWADGVNAAYIDTRSVNGGFTELHGDPPHILGSFARWKRQHELYRPGDPVIVPRIPSWPPAGT